MIWLQILVTMATLIAISAGIPQLLKLIRLKSSAEFSLSTWAMWVAAQLIFVSYAVSINDRLLIMVNGLWVLFYLSMIVLIMRYRPKEQRRFAFARLYIKDSWARLQPVKVSTDINEGINDDINKVY